MKFFNYLTAVKQKGREKDKGWKVFGNGDTAGENGTERKKENNLKMGRGRKHQYQVIDYVFILTQVSISVLTSRSH